MPVARKTEALRVVMRSAVQAGARRDQGLRLLYGGGSGWPPSVRGGKGLKLTFELGGGAEEEERRRELEELLPVAHVANPLCRSQANVAA